MPDAFGGGRNTAKSRSNFTNLHKNLSYSMHNPYPDEPVTLKDYRLHGSTSAEFALAADMNAGTAGNDDDVTRPNVTSPASIVKLANSNNHGGDGQNVLYVDGHVEFHASPFAGVKRDNIFTNKSGVVVDSTRDMWEDSILLPTDD